MGDLRTATHTAGMALSRTAGWWALLRWQVRRGVADGRAHRDWAWPVVGQTLLAGRAGQVIIGDKNYYCHDFEATLARTGLVLLRPARKGEGKPPGTRFFKPLRQIIESVNDTFKGQLDLERHGGQTPPGIMTRILQRVLALTAAIWHNDHTGQPVMRSVIA
jgi:hypothetical protein